MTLHSSTISEEKSYCDTVVSTQAEQNALYDYQQNVCLRGSLWLPLLDKTSKKDSCRCDKSILNYHTSYVGIKNLISSTIIEKIKKKTKDKALSDTLIVTLSLLQDSKDYSMSIQNRMIYGSHIMLSYVNQTDMIDLHSYMAFMNQIDIWIRIYNFVYLVDGFLECNPIQYIGFTQYLENKTQPHLDHKLYQESVIVYHMFNLQRQITSKPLDSLIHKIIQRPSLYNLDKPTSQINTENYRILYREMLKTVVFILQPTLQPQYFGMLNHNDLIASFKHSIVSVLSNKTLSVEIKHIFVRVYAYYIDK